MYRSKAAFSYICLCMAILFCTGCKKSNSYDTATDEIVAIYDFDTQSPMPAHFRTTNDSIYFSDQPGLAALHMSGSAQFSAHNLPNMLGKIPLRNVIIVDLREEPHGFINDLPVSWINIDKKFINEGKTASEIEADEESRLSQALSSGNLTIYLKGDPMKVIVKNAFPEKKLAQSFSVGYTRLPVTDEHRPSNEVTDQFIEFVKHLPPNTWLHFHCKKGQGRTTTFMAMYDMIKNSGRLKFEQILRRQRDLGGADLLDIHSQRHEKEEWAKDRLEFLRQFYRYTQENKNLEAPFSVWMQKQKSEARSQESE